MMTNPQISIIVPVYNVERYLHQCLDSIIAQSFTDWEAILVDDGSKDNSGAICDEYSNKDNRFVVFHKKNGGVSSARNIGIEKARGEWICFVDADDELIDHALSTMFFFVAERDNIDIVVAGYVKCNDIKDNLYEVKEREIYLRNREEAILEVYNPSYYSYIGYPWAKIYNRDIIRKNVLRYDETIHVSEDRLFLLTYLSVISGNVLFTTEPVYYYYQRDDSVMGNLQKDFNPKVYTEIIAMGKAYRLFKDRLFSANVIKRARKEILISGDTIFRIQINTRTKNVRNVFTTWAYMAQAAGSFYIIMYFGKKLVSKIVRKICRKY